MGEWKHRAKSKTDNIPDPTEGAFFSTEAVGSISAALIREGSQNVLDEIKETLLDIRPASIKITHSGLKYAISPENAKSLIHGLMPHLTAPKNGIIPSELPDFTKSMTFLLFEDFNTKGLEGDPGECLFSDCNNPNKAHNFYFFWRAYGRSGKLANKMGSWGVGKSVFPAVSKINSFWALTIRESDKKAYLIGQSVLKTHNRNDVPSPYGYSPWGFYGRFDEEDFAMPESSIGEIKRFQELFKLNRKVSQDVHQPESETGVSIIIPYPKDEVTAESLVSATINQFFFPIYGGKLEVEIQFEDRKFLLKKQTLKEVVRLLYISNSAESEKLNKENLYSLFDMAEWILNQKENDHIRLQCKSATTAYKWTKELFEGIDLNELQKRFDKGEPISFIIPVKYQKEGEIAELREFRAYIQKDSSLLEPESIFIRDALTISGVKSLKRKGCRGIVVISDPKLVNFFGQAEGPAHTGWHKDNFRVKYESAGEIISFVQRSLQELFNRLQLPVEGLDKTLLSEFFYIDRAESADRQTGGKKKGLKKVKDESFIRPKPRPQKCILKQLENEGGFKITENPEFGKVSDGIIVKLAYDRPDGEPFKKYSPLDFNVKNLEVKSRNIKIEKLNENLLAFIPTDKSFEIKVSGFDRRRDLIVKVH